jgi:carbon-monoxide dehydrogenase small subunit
MMTPITLTINGAQTTVTAPPLKRLLDVLREDLHLTGAKEGCGEGECGSCSVLLDTGHGPELVNSCLVPILHAANSRIVTIEGLATLALPTRATEPLSPQDHRAEGASYPSPGQSPGYAPADETGGLKARAKVPSETLHPIQQCFLSEGGAQCGICTPGMVLATHHLLQKHPQPTLLQIQEGLAGNLCRCTGYMRIFAAVHQAATNPSAPSP